MARKKTKKEVVAETEVQVEVTEMKEVLNETVEHETVVTVEAPKSTWDKAVEKFNSFNTKNK
jgi:hypothetical protein